MRRTVASNAESSFRMLLSTRSNARRTSSRWICVALLSTETRAEGHSSSRRASVSSMIASKSGWSVAVAGEGNHVGRGSVGRHAAQYGTELKAHLFAWIEPPPAGMVGVPAAFAVDAVERTEFRFGGQQIDAQRETEPPRVHRPEDDVVIERCHATKLRIKSEESPSGVHKCRCCR